MVVALLIEYDGTNYAGWQNQPNALSVQESLEKAVESVFGVAIPVIGSGRTDAGVHAKGQVAHLNVPDDANSIPPNKIADAINSRLNEDVRVVDSAMVERDFHARYMADWREYVYLIALSQSVFTRHHEWFPQLAFNASMLADAAEIFEGEHNFTTFSKHNPSTPNSVCRVFECMVQGVQGADSTNNNRLVIRIRADRFIYGMCRAIVGAMMTHARNKCSLSDIASALNAQDRSLQYVLAPPTGLYLNKVHYPNDLFSHHKGI